MGVVCKQPTTPFGKSNILTSKCANVGSSAQQQKKKAKKTTEKQIKM